jgi:ankyrin repeat protein
VQPTIPESAPPPSERASRHPVSDFKGATAYGWLFIIAGSGSLIISVSSTALTAFAAGAFISGLLCIATGIAILQTQKIAVTLIWVTVVLSGIGVIVRRLVPIDILLWLANLALALWYTNKRRLLTNSDVAPSRTADRIQINAKGKQKLLIIGTGCLLLVVACAIGLRNPQYARLRLRLMGVDYDASSFVSAASDGKTSEVELFLTAGMSPNTAALCRIAQSGAFLGPTLLKEAPSGEGLREVPALAAAASMGHAGTVSLLLERGADPNDALAVAANGGLVEAVRRLLEKGADPNTALATAAIGWHFDIVRLLLDKGADPNHIDKLGHTPFGDVSAVAVGTEPVRILLDAGADINKVVPGKGCFATPLMAAATWGNTQSAIFLLDRGADVDGKDGDSTALVCAARGGDEETMRALLRRGAFPDPEAFRALKRRQSLNVPVR